METERQRVNRRFNEAHHYATRVHEHLDSLVKYADAQNIDQSELDDLIQDAKTLARRVDRLHHDTFLNYGSGKV